MDESSVEELKTMSEISEISEVSSADSLMFSRDSLKFGIFLSNVDDVTATVAFIFGVGVNFICIGVDGPATVLFLFVFMYLAGVGGIAKEANFRFLAEICNKCLGIAGFCMSLARLA